MPSTSVKHNIGLKLIKVEDKSKHIQEQTPKLLADPICPLKALKGSKTSLGWAVLKYYTAEQPLLLR